MKITIRPARSDCPLGACPPGLFLCGTTTLGFKDAQGEMHNVISGELFTGGEDDEAARARLTATPCEMLTELQQAVSAARAAPVVGRKPVRQRTTQAEGGGRAAKFQLTRRRIRVIMRLS